MRWLWGFLPCWNFVFGALFLAAVPAAAKSDRNRNLAQISRAQMISDWKEVKLLSFQDQKKACLHFQNLSWIDEFPFQDLIQFKKNELCKNPPPVNLKSFQNLLQNGKFYREEFDYERALQFFKKAIARAKTREEKIEALEEKMKVFRSQQNHRARIQTLKQLASLDSVKYSVDYARILWTFDQIKKSQQVLKTADRTWKKAESRQMLYYIQGRISEEKKNQAQALSLYNKALNEKPLDEDSLTATLASLAWLNYKLGNFEKSEEQFSLLSEKTSERFLKSRALYWQAISRNKLNQTEGAELILNRILAEDPLSYYTVLAHRELKRPFEPISVFKGPPESLKKLKWLKESDVEKFEWSMDFDEKVFLESLLNQFSSSFFKASKSDQRILLENYWRAGLTNAMIKLLSSAPPQDRLILFQNHLNLLFPSSFENEIQTLSELEGVDPALILSLIRQESGFNPMARSPTDALGLMQVMPSAARKIAKSKKLKFSRESELLNPQFNLKIGILALKEKLEEFGGVEIFAVASYNAGSKPVRGWLKTRNRKQRTEFIEEIPYEETRSYVRLILRNQIIYKRMLAKKPFLFPEELLN